MNKYKNRYLESQIIKLSKSFPIVLLTGARQVGKTTMLKHLSSKSSKKRGYVSLDEFETRSLAKNDPALFLEQYKAPLIIDEIQYAPELLPYIKSRIDNQKKPGLYWLTGSQQFHLMKNVSESLAGRVGIVRLLGLSSSEDDELKESKLPWIPGKENIKKKISSISLNSLFKKIIKGSFPGLIHKQAPSLDSFYGSYIQTYIDRDLRDLVKVSSLSSFEKFIRICAGRTASILNLSEISKDSGVTVNTIKEWLSMLEASNQVFLLKPYYKNISKRLIKSPKLYFLDTGLVSYLTGWRDPISTSKGAFAGPLFETWVITEALKSYYHRGQEPRFFYYRTKDKFEVDLLIEKDGFLMPIEIKLASKIKLNQIKGLYQLLEKENLKVKSASVISLTAKPYVLDNNISILPPTIIN